MYKRRTAIFPLFKGHVVTVRGNLVILYFHLFTHSAKYKVPTLIKLTLYIRFLPVLTFITNKQSVLSKVYKSWPHDIGDLIYMVAM